jgi:pyruvoyl-dependent arginine decarboxylase (PvlArgDC)
MSYIVTVEYKGFKWPLKGKIWGLSMESAQRFDTREAAEAALAKAKPFMKATLWRKAQIEEVE